MNRRVVVMGWAIVLCIIIPSVGAFPLSPLISLETTLSDDTMAVFVGETNLDATIYGYQSDLVDEIVGSSGLLSVGNISGVVNLDFLSELHVIPFFSLTRLEDVGSVWMVDRAILEDPYGYEDIDELLEGIQVFSDVDIILQRGFALFGTDGSALSIDYSAGLSFSGLLQMPLTSDETINILGMISDEPVQIGYTGISSILYPYSEDTSIVITDNLGTVIQKSISQDVFYLLEDESYSITDHSSVHLFPLEGSINHCSMDLSVQPAQIRQASIDQMIVHLQNLSQQMGNMSIPFINDNNSLFNDILPVLSNIVNGGFIVVNASIPVDVDDTIQYFSDVGFARSDAFEVSITENKPDVRLISGDFRLVFLGDHFYSPQAPNASHGVAIPLLPLILWASAVILFLLFRYVIDSRYPDRTIPRIKQFGFYGYIIVLFLSLILLDRAVSYQFGSSMFDILFGQGFNILFLVFFGLELLLFGLGYLTCTIPLSMIVNQLLHYFGFKKDAKIIGKAVGSMMIWVFAAIYVTVIFNLVFLFIPLPSFM